MAITYRWANGARFKVDAKVAAAELEKVKVDGIVVPADVVDAARKKTSPLHNEFEWNDSVAAEEHRRETARLMLRCLISCNPRVSKQEVRHFSVVRSLPKTTQDKSRNVYRSTADIMADPELRTQLLQNAFAELRAFQRKYQGLLELALIYRAIEETLDGHAA